jgi:hypothetical protein
MFSFLKKPPVDESTRVKFDTLKTISKPLPPLPPPPHQQYAAYVKQAPIPYKNPPNPQPISYAPTTAQEVPMSTEFTVTTFGSHTTPLSIPPFSDGNSSFSPNLETFTSTDSSYFLTQQQSLNDLAQWATYPAVSDVFMDGFNINAVASIAANNIAITTSSPYSLSCSGNAFFQSTLQAQDLTVDSGAIKMTANHVLETIGGDLFFDTELLAKANDIQNIADWSLYPALSNLDMNGSNIINTQQLQTVQLTNASGTFGTAGQLLSSDGTKIDWVTPASPGNVSTWATFPASSNVDMNGSNISNAQKIQTVQLTNASGTFGSAGEYLTSDGTTINWTTLPPPPAAGVTSVNSAAGVITITSDSNTIVTNIVGTTTTFSAPTLGVSTDLTTTCWGTANSASLSATSASIAAGTAQTTALSAQATANSAAIAAATADATAILALSQSGVTLVNGGTRQVTIAAGSGIGVVTTFSSGTLDPTITVSASGGSGLDLNGLLNKINAYPALPYTSSTTALSSANQVATAIVPDGSFPVAVPTVGAVEGGWGFSKAAGSGAFFNWYMYNPRFGSPSAPLPYVKSRVQSCWALVRPTVNLYLPGYLALNLYSFDPANPPTSGFLNSRWAYSNLTGAVAGATGTNLFAGYTYLLYANDTPRITNTSAIGVPDSQVSGLRDPYDIYTDVNHIALGNCVVAFNPWTNGTNFRTWTPTFIPPALPFVTGDTVIFAGSGTNYNGLFFIATGVPAAATPPMVNGVVSANWALISPQPSSFADQPVVGMTLTQSTSSGQAVGYVVLDMGFSYGPTTTSTTVSQAIELSPA